MNMFEKIPRTVQRILSVLAWNCRGLGNPRTVRALKKLLRDKDPTLVFISETRKKDFEMNTLRNFNGYCNIVAVSCQGEGRERAGGVACLWKEDVIVELLSLSLNHIDVLIKHEEGETPWRFTGIYGHPDTSSKHKTCELLKHLAAASHSDRWLLMGDFNLVLSQDEKMGGNLASNPLIELFRDTLQGLDLTDLGFERDKYTWCNNQIGEGHIKARLDRAVASADWKFLFPRASLLHLTRHASDHLPIWLRLEPRKNRCKRSFMRLDRFEECWLRDPALIDEIRVNWANDSQPLCNKIPECVKALNRWGDGRFGDIPNKLKQVRQKLDNLQPRSHESEVMVEISQLEKTLDDLLESEEVWWAQRSRAIWLQHGDKNTNFFHQKASQRKTRNWVDSIFDDYGEKFTDEEDIANVITSFFHNLFTSEDPSRIEEAVEVVKGRVTTEMKTILEAAFTAEEVFHAMKSLKPRAAPGPDGMPALFYQNFWSIVGGEVTHMVLNVLNNGLSPSSLNHTFICLIPKKKKPKHTGDFRPISLCNVIFKIITKTIANRLKMVLPLIIGNFQSAFVPDRLITDNALIAFDSFHYMRKKKKGKKGYIGLKLDMSKAYDRIEWNFLTEVLKSMGFSQEWTSLIHSCISTVSFSVLLNGSPCRNFVPERGLRQGDPLSPYLFIMCAEVFSGLLIKAQERRALHGIQIARRAPMITHLFFADDSLIFCRDTQQEAQEVKSILELYQSASGQLINLDKSEISFSRNVPTDRKTQFQGWMQIKAVECHSKYLGLPTFVGRSKQQVFNFVQDRVWKKLKGWKDKFLSSAGREVLIKAVVQAIPTYIMSCFLLPKELCEHIESMISKFWWGSKQGERKIHWINWNSMCKDKKSGGMGFRRLSDFNVALLAKQGWRIIHNPDSLVSQCLKARYFPRLDFLKAPIGHNPSFTWRSIFHARKVLEKACFWRVGSGNSIDIWSDNWLPNQCGHKIWTPKPLHTNVSYVSDLINHDNNCWDVQLISSLFMPFEAHQILQLPLPYHTQRDRLVWGPDRRGIFSVKSAYHFLRAEVDRSHAGQSDFSHGAAHWSRVWNIKATPRHTHLVWRILHDRLPTKNALFQKGVVQCPQCARCSRSVENLNHIFMECEWSKLVWFASPLGIRFEDQIVNGVLFKDWLAETIKVAEDKVLQLVFSTCYVIWSARNKLCFDQKMVSVQQAISQSVSAVNDFNSHNLVHGIAASDAEPRVERLRCNWCPPPTDSYKLNVDAAGPLNGEWGVGAIIRNSLGEVMAAGRWKLPCIEDIAVAEALALKTGLKFASEIYFPSLVAETNSSIVAAAVNSSASTNDYLGVLIQDCKSVATSFTGFSCAHIRRQANQAAHGLARSALAHCNEVWMEEIPSCIADIIALDCSLISVE